MKASVSVTIDISKRHVWEALVIADQRKKWWADGIALDARVGGLFRDSWNDGTQERITEGVVESCVPGELLSLTWRESDWPEGAVSRVLFVIESEGFKARVSIIHELMSGFSESESESEWDQISADFLPGWSELLASLKLFLHRCSSPSSHDLVFRKNLPWPAAESFERLCGHSVFVGSNIVESESPCKLRVVWAGTEMHPVMRHSGYTLVEFVLRPKSKNSTDLVITHTGFGFSGDWQAARLWHDLFWKKFLNEFVDEM